MVSKVLLALCVVVAVAAAIPGPAVGGGGPAGAAWPAAGVTYPWIPSWLASAPWMRQWVPCSTIGSTCLNCNTKVVCTKIGGMNRPCLEPTPYCNDGACSATPAPDCVTASAVPAQAGAA